MPKQGHNLSRLQSLPPEVVAFIEGNMCSFGVIPDWLGPQATIWFYKILSRAVWPDFVFAFHDGEEIGPRMLTRIAKHTGLKPEDL